MFINRHLISFASGHEVKIIKTCLLQLILTVSATLVSLCIAFVVRMIQGDMRIPVFHHVRQIIPAIAFLIGFRFVVSKQKTIAA